MVGTALAISDPRVFAWVRECYEPKIARTWHLWTLTGPAGAVQFKAWCDEPGGLTYGICVKYAQMHCWDDEQRAWSGVDLGYHARRPAYDGQEPITDDCALIGGRCYYDGSGLQAEGLLRAWFAAGRESSLLWAVLADRYDDWLLGEAA